MQLVTLIMPGLCHGQTQVTSYTRQPPRYQYDNLGNQAPHGHLKIDFKSTQAGSALKAWFRASCEWPLATGQRPESDWQYHDTTWNAFRPVQGSVTVTIIGGTNQRTGLQAHNVIEPLGLENN